MRSRSPKVADRNKHASNRPLIHPFCSLQLCWLSAAWEPLITGLGVHLGWGAWQTTHWASPRQRTYRRAYARTKQRITLNFDVTDLLTTAEMPSSSASCFPPDFIGLVNVAGMFIYVTVRLREKKMPAAVAPRPAKSRWQMVMCLASLEASAAKARDNGLIKFYDLFILIICFGFFFVWCDCSTGIWKKQFLDITRRRCHAVTSAT